MSDIPVKLMRGNADNFDTLTKVDGQFIVGLDGSKISAFGMDYEENSTQKRAIMKMPTIQLTTAQLTASSWANSRYSFENDYPFSNYDLDISLAESATDAQIASFSKAQIIADDSENTLIARGSVPLVDIPVKMEVKLK